MSSIVINICKGLVIAALITLSACAPSVQPEHLVPQSMVLPNHGADSPLHGSIVITKVGGGEEANLLMVPQVGNTELQEALRLSLSQYGFLSASNAAARFRLEVFLIELKQPVSGFAMIVDSFVRYKLIRSRDGKVLYDDIVTASYKATVDDAFFGPERLKLANEGSIRANIAAFLERMNSLKITESTPQ